MNPFQNALSFSKALKTNREETIRLLMERRAEEWLEDGRGSAIECLTRWAMDGLNLGDDKAILGLAEGLCDDDDHRDPA
jgi:hypothetical protein